MTDKSKPRPGCSGPSKPGKRTSAARKARQKKIQEWLCEKKPLTKRQQKTLNKMSRK